ncbi:entericidin EcnA/B family protein [Brevundimonas diminuta ATCC 11568]|nr:entericidin EcnA/B family protein [Brevundimonas diminuta ATCC 11568]
MAFRKPEGFRPDRPMSQEHSMRKIIILAVAAAALTTAACNTIQGVGKDTQAAGQAVEGAARDAKN